tara:strand:- start:118 stop:1269 length:1152 start_codon:yes stop_codon:yes gene_type:complete
MSNFITNITEKGWESLLNNGLLNSITTFKVNDDNIIYPISENNITPNFFQPPLTGSREGATMIPICSFSQRKSVPKSPPRTEEVETLNSRVKLSFVSEDCSVPFEESNITVRVNIDKWIDNLTSLVGTTYTRTASGLKIPIWDYILAYLEEYNSGTKTWSTTETYKSNLDVSYNLLSSKDVENYRLVNPKYMEVTKSGSKIFTNGQPSNRFSSNMLLSFNTKTMDGIDVYGTSSTLSLYPDRWGYVADGSFLNAGDVENNMKSNPNAYNTVYPAIIIDDKIYQIKDNKNYETVDGVGQFVWAFKDKDNTPAITGLTNKLKLFMKANGVDNGAGLYTFNINLTMNTKSGKMFNRAYQNKKVGGQLTYELHYNENIVSTKLITIN